MQAPSVLAAIVLTTSIAGCATILARDHAAINVASRTPGAQVFVDSVPAGVTPTTVVVGAHQPHVIVVRDRAGREAVCRFDTAIGVIWVVVDIVLGILPVVVDALTGEWAAIDDRPCLVDL